MMKAMLFAAGLGTRLKPFTDNKPKALAEVGGKTLLEHSIRYLQGYGITDVVVNVHHFASMIEDVVTENNGWGSNIIISDEREAVLETGGGLLKAMLHFAGEEPFLVMNVDVMTNMELDKLISFHRYNKTVATLAVMQRESSRYLTFDEKMTLCGWQNNKTGEERIARKCTTAKPFAFSGIQVLSPHIWNDVPLAGKFSLIDLYLHVAVTESIKGYDHTGDIFIDVGKPESLAQAEQLFT